MNLTVGAAAALLGLQPARVRQLLQAGAFPGAHHTQPLNRRRGEWVIPAEDVLAYRRRVLVGEVKGASRPFRVPPPLPSAEAVRQLIRDTAPGRELSDGEVEELWREMVGDSATPEETER